MHFTSAEVRLIALHACQAQPLHETVRALAEALPDATPRRILELAKGALDPDDGPLNDATESADASASNEDAHDDDANDSSSTDESAEAMAARHADELARRTDDAERADCEPRQTAERAAFAEGQMSAPRTAQRATWALSDTASAPAWRGIRWCSA